jgi:hypothetical protein
MYYENMPNPYDLLHNRTSKNEKKTDIQEGMKEGIGGAITEHPDPSPGAKTKFNGVVVAVFFILAIFMGVIYYFNSSFMLLNDLNRMINGEYYTAINFSENFGGSIQSKYIVIFLILWMAVFALNILLCKVIMNVADINQIIYITTIYYFGIVGSTMAIINNIPSLIEVFENTIGFWVLPWISNMKDVTNIFKNRFYDKNATDLANMGVKIDHDFLLTTFSLPSFHDHFKELFNARDISNTPTSSFYIDVDFDDTTKKSNLDSELTKTYRFNLLRLILQKYTIGHYMWILIASYVSILLTVNSLPG